MQKGRKYVDSGQENVYTCASRITHHASRITHSLNLSINFRNKLLTRELTPCYWAYILPDYGVIFCVHIKEEKYS